MIASLRVAWLLARRQIQNTSRWTTALVVFIMTLTFLNLVVVSGILVGLIEGAVQANRAKATGDISITTPDGRNDLAFTHDITKALDTFPRIEGYVVRYLNGATIEANYRSQRSVDELADTVGTTLTGISPENEQRFIGLGDSVVEGEYLRSNQTGYVLLGVNLLEQYLANFGNTDFQGLADVHIGDKVLISINNTSREFIVKGFVDDKAGDIALRAYVTERDFIEITNRNTRNANEISIFVRGNDVDTLKQQILASNIDPEYAVIETWEEAQGKFIEDIKGTFSILGTVIGSIALVVASITIFIIIFINAISRRKFIGILKGIGIQGRAIAIAYIIQSLFYALAGSILGLGLTYLVLVPYFQENPIDFPFSDGILVAPIESTLIRLSILLLFTVIAGFVPARIIIKKNTLDSILGR